MLSTLHYIHERSSIIPIKKNLTTQMNVNSPKGEYSRKQNFFDPSKSSPPNEFMLKLHMRLSNYNSIGLSNDIKDDNLDNE
jgi:hypothetical protein